MSSILILLIVIFVALVIIAWVDYLRYTDDVPGNSITQIIRRAAKSYPIVPALIGYVLGFVSSGLLFHLFDSVEQISP